MTTESTLGMVRNTDPATSHEAAAEVAERRSARWARIVEFLAENDRAEGWNAYEIAMHVDLGDCFWKRVSECKNRGLVVPALDSEGNVIKRRGQFAQRRECYVLPTTKGESS